MDRLDTPALPALGRLLMSLIFILSGWGKLFAAGGTIGYIAAHNLPLPAVAYAIAVIVELGGGLLLLTGLFTRPVALVLAVFCLVTAFVFHGFGDMNNQIHAMKNIALAGGFLFVAARGAGAWSLDAALRRRRTGMPLPA
ncbi:MAG: DoxX family protein [Alphaproteobacteria bacterium]|nr:DoxX family protein [Alphaproteobacteria bacterium]